MGMLRALRGFTVHVPSVDADVDFIVDEADTGEAALEKIQEAAPDILLLDLKLPGMSGIEVLEQIAAEHVDTLTIMITAYATIEIAVRATKSGAYDFLAKPFTPTELRSVIRKAAEHRAVTYQARRLAEEKRQVRFQFISVLGHELKAPLNAVEGYLNVLQDGVAPDTPAMQGEILDRCRARIEFMRKMIADLLDMTRIESGQKKRELAQVDLAAVAKQTIETAAPAAAERTITVRLHCDTPVQMVADRGEIEIVLNNLVSNAVKYNRDAGTVDISLKKQGDEVIIVVADTGIGLSKEEAAKLFSDFVRIKNEKTRGIFGSGLGLSIVKKIAELYDGAATVDSTPDEGSTFTVVLHESELDEEPKSSSSPASPAGSS